MTIEQYYRSVQQGKENDHKARYNTHGENGIRQDQYSMAKERQEGTANMVKME
jgi:hypothetical protein